ncbi:MAG: hypothetical protein WCQ77_11990 [Planctomycetota bacterium]
MLDALKAPLALVDQFIQHPHACIQVRVPDPVGGLTFSPFIDPARMLGFLLLTSPERVGVLDGKEAFQ